MLRDHRKVGLVVATLLLAGYLVESDGVAIGLSLAALAIALAAIVALLLARRAERAKRTDP
jgi:hypothetical protein